MVDQHELLIRVWGVGYTDQRDYVRVFVGSLRRKLEPDPARPRYLLTSRGPGLPLHPRARARPSTPVGADETVDRQRPASGAGDR